MSDWRILREQGWSPLKIHAYYLLMILGNLLNAGLAVTGMAWWFGLL